MKLGPLQWKSEICGFILQMTFLGNLEGPVDLVTIKTLLCLELEQIRDHFYDTNGGYLYSESGLRFAVTQSKTKLLY